MDEIEDIIAKQKGLSDSDDENSDRIPEKLPCITEFSQDHKFKNAD